MKKLSLLLLTIVVSLVAVAQLNPYAYDLTSDWDNATKKLTVTYSLNSAAYNDGEGGNPDGVQICLTDDKNDPKKYYIYEVPAANIGEGTKTFTIDLSSGLDLHDKAIPENKNLYVTVTVQGDRTNTYPKQDSRSYAIKAGHGIAVDKNPNSKNFGKIFVNEAYQHAQGGELTKYFTKGLAGMYVLDADFQLRNATRYTGGYNFSWWVIDNTYGVIERRGYQPWCVRVSDEGRIFVCSNDMHQRQTTQNANGERDGVAVWEVDRNNFNNWTPILHGYRRFTSGATSTNYTFSYKDVNGVEQFIGPICGMDVKGKGDDLTLLLYTVNQAGVWLDMNGFRAYEYNVKSGVLKPVPAFNNGGYGLMFEYVTLRYGVDGSYWFGANRADGSDGVKGNGKTKEPNLGHVKLDGTTADNTNYNSEFYGGAGLINYKSTYNNATINGTNHSWLISGKDNDGSSDGYFDVFLVTSDADGGATVTRMDGNDGRPNWQKITTSGMGRHLNDMAVDYAENLYVIGKGETLSSGGLVRAFAMPYGGEKTTIAREQFAFKYQNPVPNILATDLRYDIVRGKNQYEFSFNVNTKPEEAQIRFYESYEDMQKSLNVVNADDFDGTNTNKPVYVYNIPQDKLIQGRIAVILGAVGGQADANGVINNNRLPAGVLYWSVYVKTRESNVFAPIYRQEGTTINTGKKDDKGNPIYDYEIRHIVVNNYPETDMFGALIVAHNPSVTDDATRANRGLHIYGFNPEGNSNDEQGNINNNTRYSKRAEYLNQNADGRLHYPRRLVVGHDGKVYVADAGTATASRTTQGGVIHEHGGVKLWDPTNPNKFALFSDNKIGTATGVALYEHADGWKLYANNTYDEFSSHGDAYTKEAQDDLASYGWNGFVGYVLDKYTSGHNGSWSSWGNNATEVALRRGDASGNFAFAAMDKGLWICQYREHTVDIKTSIQQPLADNLEAYILSFVPYGTDVRTWKSSEGIGVKSYDSNGNPVWDSNRSPYSQYEDSPLQSTPGGGVAYKKINGKEYVYVVNHDGNIAVLEITGWTGTGVSSKPTIPLANIKILTTPEFTKGDRTVDKTSTKWHTAYITSMCFDYAGNLVTTTGKGYHDAHQDILVYTMPYDRVNAREIQAPNSCRMIPERIAQLDMTESNMDELIKEHKKDHPTGCAIDLYRPLQGGMFNTICLPCTLDLKTLPEGHPLYEAELKEYTGLNLNTVGGEKVLELVFEDVPTENGQQILKANTPYIIQPMDDYNSIIRFAGPLRLTNTTGGTVPNTENSSTYTITYQGIIPYQRVEPHIDQVTGESLTLMLVADNRLALMTSAGDMYGFRGYFTLNKPLPKGMQTRITTSKGTTTNTTIVVDGKKVNVEKYLQEGRVYIRMGDSLYTITGEKVE